MEGWSSVEFVATHFVQIARCFLSSENQQDKTSQETQKAWLIDSPLPIIKLSHTVTVQLPYKSIIIWFHIQPIFLNSLFDLHETFNSKPSQRTKLPQARAVHLPIDPRNVADVVASVVADCHFGLQLKPVSGWLIWGILPRFVFDPEIWENSRFLMFFHISKRTHGDDNGH